MNRFRNMRAVAFGLALGLGLHAGQAFGCAACAGQSDDLQAQGMNWGILTLLGVVAMVLGSVASFFVYLGHRAARTPDPRPETLPDSSPAA